MDMVIPRGPEMRLSLRSRSTSNWVELYLLKKTRRYRIYQRFCVHCLITRRRPGRDSFRNPAGVAFKLQNLRSFETGKGLRNVSEMDRHVWGEFGERPEEARRLASLIRSGIMFAEHADEVEDSDEDEFYEGKLITLMHKRRERHPNLRKRLLASRYKQGFLSCDMCNRSPTTTRPEFREALFEAHHLKPLSMLEERITKLSDVALLCANCHRLVHKAISISGRWLSLAECRASLM